MTQSNIWDGAFCKRFSAGNYFCKKLHLWCLIKFWVLFSIFFTIAKSQNAVSGMAILTNFKPMFHFYTPLTNGFLIFSGGIEIGYRTLAWNGLTKTYLLKPNIVKIIRILIKLKLCKIFIFLFFYTHPVITIKKSSIFHLSPKYAFFPNTPRATIFKIISSVKKENTICSRVSKTLHWSVKHSLSKGLYKASMIQLITITKITIRSNHLNEI